MTLKGIVWFPSVKPIEVMGIEAVAADAISEKLGSKTIALNLDLGNGRIAIVALRRDEAERLLSNLQALIAPPHALPVARPEREKKP